MDQKLEKQFRERAVALGSSGDPAALPELAEFTRLPVANVRRLAASAIGKLADGAEAVAALQPMDFADYKIGMFKKKQLYQQQGKRIVSLYPEDKPRMREQLLAKLAKYR